MKYVVVLLAAMSAYAAERPGWEGDLKPIAASERRCPTVRRI